MTKSLILNFITNNQPIFFLGNQKSGTTAIANIFAKLCNMEITSDIPTIWGTELQKLLNKKPNIFYFIIKNKKYFQKDVIKEPNLTFFYPQLKMLYPKATFVLITRDPRDNIRSILNRINLDGKSNYNFHEISDVIPKYWSTIFYSGYQDIFADHYIKTLAYRWNYFTDIYLNNTSSITLIRYEDFLKNKESTIKTLAKKLNIFDKSQDITGILNYQYQPRGANRSMKHTSFFSNKNLSAINSLCKNNMKRLNYI